MKLPEHTPGDTTGAPSRAPEQADNDLRVWRERLRAFRAERGWQRFHNPKNLVMALAGEVGELIEPFQWLTPDEAQSLTDEVRAEVALEMADVLFYLITLADACNVDLAAAARRKLALNAERYPVDKVFGRATKYDRL